MLKIDPRTTKIVQKYFLNRTNIRLNPIQPGGGVGHQPSTKMTISLADLHEKFWDKFLNSYFVIAKVFHKKFRILSGKGSREKYFFVNSQSQNFSENLIESFLSLKLM